MSNGLWVALTILISSMFKEMALKCMACHRECSVAGTESSICVMLTNVASGSTMFMLNLVSQFNPP